MPKQKIEEAGLFSKYTGQKLERIYTQGSHAYRSVRTLVKTSNLLLSNVRPFLHSKTSYQNFTPATCNCNKMKTIARFKKKFGVCTNHTLIN